MIELAHATLLQFCGSDSVGSMMGKTERRKAVKCILRSDMNGAIDRIIVADTQLILVILCQADDDGVQDADDMRQSLASLVSDLEAGT